MLFGAGASGPSQEIRAGLVVDQAAFQSQLAGIDAQQKAADQRIAATRARGEAVIARLKVAEAQALNLERISDRMMSKSGAFLRKMGGRAAAGYIALSVTSELGIPEAAQPLANIGTAALSGAAAGSMIPGVGTAAGAAVGAALQSVKELWNEMKRTQENLERVRAHLFQSIQRQAQINQEARMEFEEKERRLAEMLKASFEEGREQETKRNIEGARALYEPCY
jgi:hypothetical protein